MMNTPWIDVHAHLNMLEPSPEEAVRNALDAGLDRVLTIGTCPEDHPQVVELAERLAPHVYCTLGVHPHDAEKYDSACEDFMNRHWGHPRVVAVAEIGLDYYYDNAPREIQKNVFRRQLEISVQQALPVQIHTRDAEDDTIAILKEFGGKVQGLIHCFTGTQRLADEVLALGMNISFSGVVTFKNADELRSVCQSVPLERLHVETDSPFLTPVPHRGKKNQPSMVVHTAALVAQLKGVSEAELARQTRENAKKVFSKIQWPQ